MSDCEIFGPRGQKASCRADYFRKLGATGRAYSIRPLRGLERPLCPTLVWIFLPHLCLS